MATPGEASPFFKDVGSESDEDDESFDGVCTNIWMGNFSLARMMAISVSEELC